MCVTKSSDNNFYGCRSTCSHMGRFVSECELRVLVGTPVHSYNIDSIYSYTSSEKSILVRERLARTRGDIVDSNCNFFVNEREEIRV